MRHDLHTHSTFSDGFMEPGQICDAALRAGLASIGISDHFVSRKLPETSAVTPDGVEAYVRELQALKRFYRGGIRVLGGLEIAFSLLLTDFTFLTESRHGEHPLDGLDSLLFEYVNEPAWTGLELTELVKIRDIFPMPVGLAHNDIDQNFQGIYSPLELAEVLARESIFVELCPSARNSRQRVREDAAKGEEEFVPYYRVASDYCAAFYEAAKNQGLLFAIGTDSHGPEEGIEGIDEALEFLREKNLEKNLLIYSLATEGGVS